VSMWNKRREDEESPPRRASVAPHPVETRKETVPLSSTPNPPHRPAEPDRGSASIGKAVRINGQISSKEDLYVDGDVEGIIEALEHRLTVGPNGRLQAGVKAREVVVLGMVQGNVEAAERIDIRKDAKLIGDIKTARIVIEDGAYFKGSIDIVRPEPAKVVPTPPRPPEPALASAAMPGRAIPAEVKR
jgi:cytoskeletal protein CcmA (bactofilin family)